MKIADTARSIILGIYRLSPYCWADSVLRSREERHAAGSPQRQALRATRLELSERYIGYWLFAAIGFYLASELLPAWLAVLLLLRAVGILNKELGVVLFGICKITEGSAVSATGRVIVLALVNYLTALFLFAASYAMLGEFTGLPDYAAASARVAGLLHAAQIHFSLASSFEPATLAVAALSTLQSAYCFLFGALVISLFVSLLSVKPLQA